MTDSMKFGPEWLRNLAGDSCSTAGGGESTLSLTTPRYQLAEHRYGREEMLALFDRTCKPPEQLTTFSSLFVDKTQLPLALIQMTEDETRMWNGGISTMSGRGGRGGSVDRGGRGRNGRGGLYSSHYSRGVGFDDSGDGPRIDNQSFPGRNRPFDRSQSERGWSERNGVSEPGEWNGSSSPRKEISRGASGSSLMEGNWRRYRGGGEDEDSWRKWGRNSWRDGGSSDRDRLDRSEGDGEEVRVTGARREHRGNHRVSHDSSHHPPTRSVRTWDSNHHDNHGNLPEWVTENPSESGGSFDASGAFHGGMYSDEDDDRVINAGGCQESRTRRVSEGSSNNTAKPSSKPIGYSAPPGPQVMNRSAPTSSVLGKERPKSLHPFEDKDESLEKERRTDSPIKPPLSNTDTAPSKSQPVSTADNLQKRNTTASTDKTENEKIPTKETVTNSKSPNRGQIREKVVESDDKIDQIANTAKISLQTDQQGKPMMHGSSGTTARQKSEDDLDRMKEEADALVAKLMADEENHREKTSTVPPSISGQSPAVNSANGQEKWFYRDPQGEVQGPFLASEMAEWCKAGYFTAGLMVRRTCDERYATLGDLMQMCGRIPFTPGPPIPPLKLSEQVIPPVPSSVPAGMPAGVIPKPGIDDPLLLLQYHQMRLLQNQQLLLRQIRQSAIAKLSQSEHWASLSPVEQNQLIHQYTSQDPEVPEVPPPMPTNPFVPHMPSQASNPVMQLFTQMQQAKTQPETHLPSTPHQTTPAHPPPVDPIQQLIQQMGGMQNIPGVQQTNITPSPPVSQEDNPIKSLLRQLNVNVNGHPQPPHVDTVWPQAPPQIPSQFNAQNWLTQKPFLQVGPMPAMPPGQLPSSLWDIHTKEMKTEQQILEEQNLKLQEDRKKEELRKQEELQRQQEEENAKRKKEEQARQAEEAKRKDAERKRKEEEKKRKEEEKRKQEEEKARKEEKKRKEEEKKREEKRKQEEENLKKKQEEEKRKREEQKKQEEKLKKEEEKRRKLEEEQKKKEEEERQRKEAEARKQEAEEQARRAEQRRREEEALRKLQEKSKAPWAQASRTPAPTSHPSLAEIQRLEREMKAEEQQLQQLLQMLERNDTVETAQEATTESSKRTQFKWAEKATNTNKPLQVKTLTQIQREEQERIAKVKQQERERQEKAGQKDSASVLQNAGIWGTASQCLNWANSSTSSSNQAWTTNTSTTGFWDEPTPTRATVPKQPAKPTVSNIKTATANSQQQQSQQQQSNKPNKSKNKREEELVKKLFEQNTAKTDEFTQWCTKALNGIQASVDIPTFIGFLRDIESPYEVKEYVRVYLGDTKQSSDFAKQFLEKRTKWRSSQRPQAQADDLCKPAPAVNPNAPAEFQEVKGKSKKPKKGKMFKVDNRILGFSVTAAPDRINVGDRDYGEGV